MPKDLAKMVKDLSEREMQQEIIDAFVLDPVLADSSAFMTSHNVVRVVRELMREKQAIRMLTSLFGAVVEKAAEQITVLDRKNIGQVAALTSQSLKFLELSVKHRCKLAHEQQHLSSLNSSMKQVIKVQTMAQKALSPEAQASFENVKRSLLHS